MENEQEINIKVLIGKLLLLIGIIVFISIFSSIFGSDNTLIGVVIITAILMFSSMNLSLEFKDAILGIIVFFSAMGITSYFVKYHPYIGIVVDFILVFLMTYIFSIDTKKKLYLLFILCYVFLQGSPSTDSELPTRVISLFIGGALVAIIYYLTHRKAEEEDRRTIKDMLSNIDIHSLQTNFSLRMAIGITIAIFIGTIFDFTKGMWITSTVLSLTQPYYNDIKEKIGQRLVGTIIGAIIFIILFNFLIPKSLDSIVLLVIGYIYSFIKPYKIQMIFVTLNSLAAAMILFDASISVPMRIFFVIIGIVIAVLVNGPICKIYENTHKEQVN
ncbi:hypothetical protein U729_669 [Clostridium baratii str. Sullivan]|uniref:Integral membrane bound transporter domain-containing protein n=1 Tax=Clostridium baratii str. Sullivan TaxID=1415775 RepID=A0A0A7FYV4_9CLOT|nr:FUSC family protein [Clostridium baratii]AIY84031.1 hypothetical protein U729_669 [Clostridium baratii str. Sullivan]